MDLEGFDPNIYSTSSISSDRRNIKFYEITGRTLVHPLSYRLKKFQKDIILTALHNNTLISLPPGLGKLYVASILTFNFHRWFVNGKILILSQTRSYLHDLLNAFRDYTSLANDDYCELPANAQPKESSFACEKSIILTSPQKLVELVDKDICKIQNVVLVAIFESSKITKCQQYKEVLDRLKKYEFRLLLFVDPAGFNSKNIKQVVDEFNISKLEVRNLDSVDIRQCTYHSKIEFTIVDISPHIGSIKDSFYAVFEKYGKKLKDAKVITGNVAGLTRAQIHKAKEKFKKSPPPNMSQTEKDDMINSMTICAFLCHGIELLHNWGVGVFYNYLFDEQKDADLKLLIVNDDHLVKQMLQLNEYLKKYGNKTDVSLSFIVHPKLIQLKKIVTEYFSKNETNVDEIRIIIICSIDDAVDEIDRLFRTLPDFIRYHCIKTKAKCLAHEPDHKEIVKNFLDGIISVLVLSNLVDEVMEIKSSLIISLDPNKTLLKTSDARFFEGTSECIFVLTRGSESTKFEVLWNEKKNEQKPLDVNDLQMVVKESSQLFDEDFNPEFECTGINIPKKDFKNSPGQKTLFHYLTSSQDNVSPSLFENTGLSSRKSKTSKHFFDFDSPSLFPNTFEASSVPQPSQVNEFYPVTNDLMPTFSIDNKHLKVCDMKFNDDDSFDDLILDFPETSCLKTVTLSHKPAVNDTTLFGKPPTSETTSKHQKKFSWTKKPANNSDFDKNTRDISEFGKCVVVAAEVHPDPYNKELLSEVENRIEKNKENNISAMNVANETFVDFLFDDDNLDDVGTTKQDCQKENVKLTQPNLFSCCTPLDTIDKAEELIQNTTVKKDFACESFVDDLFADDSEPEQPAIDIYNPNLINDTDALTANKSCPKNGDYTDSDSDFIASSPPAKPRFEVFSSRSIESLNAGLSQVSQNLKRSTHGDLFPNSKSTEYSDVDDFRCSFNSNTEHNSFSRLIKSNANTDKSTQPSISVAEIPSEFLSNFEPATGPLNGVSSMFATKSLHDSKLQSLEQIDSPKSGSPILFSARKPFRDRSRLNLSNDQSTSIKFESTFDISENQLQHLDEIVAKKSSPETGLVENNESKKVADERKSSTPGRFFRKSFKYFSPSPNSNFPLVDDDETATKRWKSKVNCTDHAFEEESKRVSEEVSPSIHKNSMSTKPLNSKTTMTNDLVAKTGFVRSLFEDDIFENIADKVAKRTVQSPNEFSSTPKRTLRTPNRVESNASTPDGLIFDDYSTPEVAQTEKSELDLKETSKSISLFRSTSSNKTTIEFSDFSFDDAILDGIELKGKNAAYNSHMYASGNRNSSTKSVDKLSTMEQLNLIKNDAKANNSSDVSLVNSSSTSRFSFLKKRTTSLFSRTIKQNEKKNLHRSPAIDSDEEFAWLNTSPINGLANKLCFKKPEPVAKKSLVSRHSTPVSSSKSDHEVRLNSSTPDDGIRRPKTNKKRAKLKRNLVEQFLDKEAEVSGDEGEEDDDEWLDNSQSQFAVDSFIDDDEIIAKPPNMTNYLKSIKSPENVAGKFRIPVLSESRLRMNVCSQTVEHDQSYENDSFCVDDSDSEEESLYGPSVLTQMEEKLMKKKQKKMTKPRRQFKRIIVDSSPDSPQMSKERIRKRSKRSLSSDSDTDCM